MPVPSARWLLGVLIGIAVAAWSSHLAAQHASGGKVPRIGVLWHAGDAEQEKIPLGALRDGLRRKGYVDGRNVILENRYPDERPFRQ